METNLLPLIIPALKYKALIDGLQLTIQCPDIACVPINKVAFRWVKEDFNDGQSFLPNFIYDQNRGAKPRKNDIADEFKCGMCALSFFETILASKNSVETIGGAKKIKKLLGYSHIASGALMFEDGLATSVDTEGHFMLFEYENIVLDERFSIVEEL